MLKPRLVGERAAGALAATFAVLGDPTRVRLLDALAQRELCVCNLAALVGITESAVSHQLRLLRTLRLVRSRRAGRMVFYALDNHHIRTLLQQGRTHIEEATRTAGAASDEPTSDADNDERRTTSDERGEDQRPATERARVTRLAGPEGPAYRRAVLQFPGTGGLQPRAVTDRP